MDTNRKEPTLDSRCGTPAGYKAHLKRGEKYCDSCKKATSVYRANLKLKNPEQYKNYIKVWKEKNPNYYQDWLKKKYPNGRPIQLDADGNPKKRNKLNTESEREYKRRYYLEHKDFYDEYSRNWKKNNPDKVKMKSARRRAKKFGLNFEKFTDEQVLKKYGTDCYICKTPIDLKATRQAGKPGWEKGLHIDHHIPISKGGPHTLANVRPTHAKCNILKKDCLPETE